MREMRTEDNINRNISIFRYLQSSSLESLSVISARVCSIDSATTQLVRTCVWSTFTFYGGHDPEDYTHKVGDPPTDLKLHKNSPGYRLILNNILFPAAKKKKLKT